MKKQTREWKICYEEGIEQGRKETLNEVVKIIDNISCIGYSEEDKWINRDRLKQKLLELEKK